MAVKKVEEKTGEISEEIKDKKNAEQAQDNNTVKSKPKKSLVNESDKSSDSEQMNDKKLEKQAEAESQEDTKEAKSLEEKKKELLARAKKLAGEIDVATTEELKEKVKVKKRTDMLIPLEEYVKAGIYLGTKVVTPDMRPFVYRRRADGLAIFNTDLIDEKLREGIEFLSKFDAQDVIVVCKRQAGWRVVEKFGELTGIRTFTQKYPAGILTNTALPDFFENELTIISDAWLDKNALNDTLNVKKKVLMVCDTNNFAKKATQVIIGNNKSPKSLGVIFYLLTRGYCKAKGIEAPIPELEWWTGEDKEVQEQKQEEELVQEKIAESVEKVDYGV